MKTNKYGELAAHTRAEVRGAVVIDGCASLQLADGTRCVASGSWSIGPEYNSGGTIFRDFVRGRTVISLPVIEDDSILELKYVDGSGGCRNMFYRAANTIVHNSHGQWLQEKEVYVVQWEGSPKWSSGYAAHEFASREEAEKFFNEY